MHVVQRDLGPIPETFKAKYVDSGSDGAVAVGYVVCYDVSQPITHAADDWAENERFKVVTKPKTAILNLVAGVVVAIDHSNDDGTFVIVQSLKRGNIATVLCKVNATVGTSLLKAVNDEWHLAVDASATPTATVGIAGETADTSTTAANKVVVGAA